MNILNDLLEINLNRMQCPLKSQFILFILLLLVSILIYLCFDASLIYQFSPRKYLYLTSKIWSPQSKSNHFGNVHVYSDRIAGNSSKEKLIVLHSRVYDWADWFGLNYTKDTTFYRLEYGGFDCPAKCVFTHEKRYACAADAIHFSVLDSLYHPDPPLWPATRRLNQFWIGQTSETDGHHAHGLYKFPLNSLFNWTASHRQDSDVYMPYGYTVKIDYKFGPSGSVDLTLPTITNLTGKKLATALISNCNTFSQREELIVEMKKFIPIDIYGGCGITCPNGTDCRLFLAGRYKFYLAFENSLCEDYVTEKFFSALKNDIVPVVYGLADYKKLAPPHSYINVMDFSSVHALTKYLLYLDKNHTEYLKYFEWKRDFQILQHNMVSLCEICKKLWAPEGNPRKEYSSWVTWWTSRDPNDYDKNESLKENLKGLSDKFQKKLIRRSKSCVSGIDLLNEYGVSVV